MAITIVGLGPGDGRFLTREAWDNLSSATTIYLRTRHHPAVAELPGSIHLVDFDSVYDSAENFEDVYTTIVNELIRLERQEDIIYAVPGHPFVGESTAIRLIEEAAQANIQVNCIAGLSFVEPILTALRVDALNGLQIFDAIETSSKSYPPLNPDFPVIFAQLYNRLLASELKIVLTAVYPDEHPVYLVHAAGTKLESVEAIPLYAIDRSQKIGHLTALFIPPVNEHSSLTALAETVATLRGPNGCPWDQEQTPKSVRNGLLEEASEVLEALDAGDPLSLREELGDLLYHIVMQAQMASENGDFTLSDLIAGIEAKLKRRHPHVWGDWTVNNTDEVLENWELLKQNEKTLRVESILDNIPVTLPALARSQKIQDKARRVGFDWPEIEGVYGKLAEELAELQAAQTQIDKTVELGDLLFVMVNLASWLGIDAESALREANLKFVHRFRQVEQLMHDQNLEWEALDLPAMEALWQEVKRNTGGSSNLLK